MEKLTRISSLLKNQRGLTLVELLASLVLISIVLVMVSSIHLMGIKQYSVQSQDVKNQDQVRLAMAMVTNDIRQASDVEVDQDSTTLMNQLTLQIGARTIVYSQNQNSLLKNGQPLISGIQQFNVTQTGKEVSLSVVSIPNQDGKSETLSTNLYTR